MGDMLRLRARFDEALDHYLLAERLYTQERDSLGRSRALAPAGEEAEEED